MKHSRFTEKQIIGVLWEQAAGSATADVYRKHGISPATSYQASRHGTGPWPLLVIMLPSPHGVSEPDLLLVAGSGCGPATNLGH